MQFGDIQEETEGALLCDMIPPGTLTFAFAVVPLVGYTLACELTYYYSLTNLMLTSVAVCCVCSRTVILASLTDRQFLRAFSKEASK